jgi:formamidopyrimidine-DNA glycosylase
MPELPEVETVVRGLRAAGLEGAMISHAVFHWPRTAAGPSAAALATALCGRRIVGLSRRAKYIVLALDDGRHLLVHLRMTGKFRIDAAAGRPGPHDHAVLTLSDGRHLVFNDTRKFGRFQLVDELAKHLAAIGPEPLEDAFTPAAFRERLHGHRRMVKPLLLDQTCVAGLGNIYVDEALWAARIHPMRRADTLTPAEIRRLHAAIRDVLGRAVAANGTTLGSGATNFYSVAGRRGRHADALQVFRRTGEPCPRCGRPITRLLVGQRGTHVCARCQVEREQ